MRTPGGYGTLAMVLAAGLSVAALAWAESGQRTLADTDYVDRSLGKYGLHPAFEKFGRGVSNLLGGWLEIPLNIQSRYSNKDTAGSLATGLLYGTVYGVVRTGVGAYETVTFLLPYPEDFAPILPPIGYFNTEGKRKPLLWE
ncbi:MAG: exosortase system-associated protein, TIGR04073 family [Candidatus Omnitrophica bacterium]|nr:exosortase system-associated protein, TIGR04073 family [Candidatus Omnitrophota bacterium]